MAKPFIATGNLPFEGIVNRGATVGASGDTEDFTWSVEYSLDGGTTWSVYKTEAGDSVFTGGDAKQLVLVSKNNRVILLTMGTATTVSLEGAA